jgi:hypothetical protein
VKKILLLSCLFGVSINAFAYFEPNSNKFTCPDDKIVDTSQLIQVTAGQLPVGVGKCYWTDPVYSYGITNGGKTILGYTTWVLSGGWLSDGCYDVHGSKQTTEGVIVNVSCKQEHGSVN